MTIFTINAFDDGYFKDGYFTGRVQNFCFNSWLKNGIDVKIFDYNSPEVIEAKEIFKDYINVCLETNSANSKACATDPIKFYILSLYPNMLYVDTDLYLYNINEEKFRDKFSMNSFFAIYNGTETYKAKKFLELFKDLKEKKISYDFFDNDWKTVIEYDKLKGFYYNLTWCDSQNKSLIVKKAEDIIENLDKYRNFITLDAFTKKDICKNKAINFLNGLDNLNFRKDLNLKCLPTNPKELVEFCANSTTNPEAYYDSLHT